MKKIVFKTLLITVIMFAFCSCAKEQNIVFNAAVEQINENSLLVSTVNYEGFDKASVGITEETVFAKTKLSDMKIGDML